MQKKHFYFANISQYTLHNVFQQLRMHVREIYL